MNSEDTQPVTNAYSPTWFALFAQSIPDDRTAQEVEFLTRQLPRPRYTRIADLCCGTGRHARALCDRGYEVVGIDRSHTALREARQASTSDADLTYH